MSDEVTTDEATPEAPDIEQDAAVKPVNKLFRYSAHINLGDGADECQFGETGRCTEVEHFHAWIRLPNQFQHDSIQSKAKAARARMQRALRDPESDAHVVFEEEMDAYRGETTKEQLIEALVTVNDLTDRLAAMGEVEEIEEWQHRSQDVYRRRELEALPEDERNQDELAQLIRESDEYVKLVEAKIEENREPRKAALQGLTPDDLIGQLRDQRIVSEGNAAFSAMYTRYQWFIGTLKPCLQGHPQDRVFKELKDLDAAAPEVVEALRLNFHELEMNLQREVSGNW